MSRVAVTRSFGAFILLATLTACANAAGSPKASVANPISTVASETPTIDCSTPSIFAGSESLLLASSMGDPVEDDIKYWRGARTDAEIASMPSMRLLKVASVVETVAQRESGGGYSVKERLDPGNVTLLIRSALYDYLAKATGKVWVLGLPVSTESGPALLVRAALLGEPSLFVYPGCDEVPGEVNLLSDRLSNGDMVGLVANLVTEWYSDAEISQSVEGLLVKATVTMSEADYEEAWRMVPIDQRSLQIGSVPRFLDGSVSVSGLILRSDVVARSVVLVLWSDLGVSAEVHVPSVEGPLPIVVPDSGTLKLSLRSEDGTLGRALSEVKLPLSDDSAILVDYNDGDVEAKVISMKEFSSLAQLGVESLERLRLQYQEDLFWTESND